MDNKAGGFAPPISCSSMFPELSSNQIDYECKKYDGRSGSAPPSAGNSPMFYPPPKIGVLHKHTEIHEMSSDQIDYACKVMTEKHGIDPVKARMFFIPNRAWVRRKGRKTAGEEFRKEYAYGSGKDKKTIIWPGDTLSWQDESSGIMWVAVHGMDSICVVTSSGELDVTRLCGSLVHIPMHKVSFKFRKCLIDEIEDLADTSSKLRQRFHQKIEKPFGVVSVIPNTNKVPSTEYGEMKAIKFLQEKLNSGTDFTVNETIQIAISAFQHLFQKEFNADEIQVSVMDPKYSVTNKYIDPTVEELNIAKINEHLDVINKEGMKNRGY